MTIELLAPHLQWLERQSLELAAALRFILDYLARPQQARKVPRYAAAEVVARMDQWSAAAHNGRDLQFMLREGGAGRSVTRAIP